MLCQFSERNYEQCLNNELVSNGRIFVPSQSNESDMGFDAAIFSRSPRFWRLWSSWWPFSFAIPPRRSVELNPDLFDELEHELDSNNFPPRFKANVFIQHKRPDYLSTRVATEYSYWNRPYFRYYVEQNQQNTLSQLETNVSSRALVVYACPAFWQHGDLFNFSTSCRVVENSNFVKPSVLDGHHKYTFVNAGILGRAFSDPKDIPKVNLLEEIGMLKELPAEKKNSQFIKSLSAKMIQIVEKSDEPFMTNFNGAMKYFGTYGHELANSISKIRCFLFITNISWLIVY